MFQSVAVDFLSSPLYLYHSSMKALTFLILFLQTLIPNPFIFRILFTDLP